MGITYESVGDAEIRVEASGDGVSLVANRDGLQSLLQLIEDMLASPSAHHVHLTPAMQLAPDSQPLVVSCNEGGALPEGFPADFDEMSLDARRIWRLEAQLLRLEKLTLKSNENEAISVVHRAWIWEENVHTMFETLSRWLDYAFDSSDWIAVTEGIKTTDVENDEWYSYPLIGSSRADVDVARDVGASPVHVRIALATDTTPQLHVKVDTLLELLNAGTLQDDRAS